MKGLVKEISYKEAVEFLLPRHYSGRKPQITKAFGLFADNSLKAVCTFGKPATPALCVGICGKDFSAYVYELNRLCRTEDFKEPLSHFVSVCLKKMSPAIIVSYADTAMNHHGYIYQACNFLYTGCTKEKMDKWTPGHPRHYKKDEQNGLMKIRSAKHRYVFFSARGHKNLLKEWKEKLKYPVMKYPKGDNSNYTLGCFIKERIVKKITEREMGN